MSDLNLKPACPEAADPDCQTQAFPFRLARLGARIPTLVLMLVFVLLLTAHSSRTFSRVTEPGIYDNWRRGFVDFHNAIHFPTKSFLNGENPYGSEYASNHPDGRTFPLFPPQSLILHAPFGIGNIAISRIAYWFFELGMMSALLLLIQWTACRKVTVRGFLFLGIALMLTIPFYTSFYMGQLTLQLVVGAIVALHFSRDRPLLAAIGLTVAACKPQFGIPLALLLLCRYDWKAAIGGGLFSVILSGIGLTIICSGYGWSAFAEEIKTVYFTLDSHPDVGTALENGWRLDIYPVVARMLTSNGEMPAWSKFVIPAAYLGIGGWGVFLLRRHRDADPLSNLIICLTCLGCIYHSVYDAILLLWPAAVIWYGRAHVWQRIPIWASRTVLLILILVLVNVFHLEGVQVRLGVSNTDFASWRVLVSLGAIGIFIALLTTVELARRVSAKPVSSENPS